MNELLLDPRNWRVSPANLNEALAGASPAEAAKALASAVACDRELRVSLENCLAMQSGEISPAFLAPGHKSDYLALDVLLAIEPDDTRHDLLRSVALSRSALMPVDLRAAALRRLVHEGQGSDLVERWRLRAPSLPNLPEVDRLHRDSDGIDHLFDVPESGAEFADFVLGAAHAFQEFRITSLIERAVAENPQCEQRLDSMGVVVSQHVADPLLSPEDYLVPWDRTLTLDEHGQPVTIAEVCKALLLHPSTRVPNRAVRSAAVSFYRAVLGVPGRAVVGIGAGFLYVEHGSVAEPSYVFVGQGAIIGKGVTLDTVGGIVLGRESFIGGGFMPLLIHTHKHIRERGTSAATERLQISRTGFVAEDGARYPMGVVGMFECADYVNQAVPFEGIRVVPIIDKGE